ncbi:MAG TPA: GGDEF domain-containing protein, partial [Anaerolineales bacterium]|nr:GGDEF domain-containing protein [Anaerolineales bacterium]
HTGDEALKALATHCNAVLRATDIFARYGGDEFICLLPNTNLSQAQEIARRVREKTNQIPLSHGETPLYFTTSIGVTTTTDEVSLEAFIAHADQALYEAKNRGRDQIRVYN